MVRAALEARWDAARSAFSRANTCTCRSRNIIEYSRSARRAFRSGGAAILLLISLLIDSDRCTRMCHSAPAVAGSSRDPADKALLLGVLVGTPTGLRWSEEFS